VFNNAGEFPATPKKHKPKKRATGAALALLFCAAQKK